MLASNNNFHVSFFLCKNSIAISSHSKKTTRNYSLHVLWWFAHTVVKWTPNLPYQIISRQPDSFKSVISIFVPDILNGELKIKWTLRNSL